jgi:hypothetical protein
MDYLVRRGEQEFGPYTLSELQGYVQSGHVSWDDLTKSDGMAGWESVSRVLGNIPVQPAVPGARAAEPVDVPTVKLPWNLHWLIVLILVAITRQLFNFVWVFVLALWAKRLSGENKPVVLVSMYPASFLAAFFAGAFSRVLGVGAMPFIPIAGGFLVLAGLVAYLMGIFSIKSAMEDYYNSTENVGMVLSGPMTFFFSSIYLQYHVNKLARWKKTGVYI